MIVYGMIASVISVVIYIAGNCFLPEFKSAVAFTLKLTGLKKLLPKKQ